MRTGEMSRHILPQAENILGQFIRVSCIIYRDIFNFTQTTSNIKFISKLNKFNIAEKARLVVSLTMEKNHYSL